MTWTKEQQLAIDQRNKNILVAAAAGSGKTAVLVERIKKLILEEGISIDRMLIVTFTNAAASEMKEKIRKALIAEIDRAPEDSTKLREQLALLGRAQISTFHAFALDVIRRFFYQIDIEPGFSICDDAQRTMLREDAMDQLMETCFAEGSGEFYDFLNWYGSDRNQDQVREIIGNAYNVLQSLPDPWRWLQEKVEMLSQTPEEMRCSPLMDGIWRFTEDSLHKAAGFSTRAIQVLRNAGLERMAQKVEEEELYFYRRLSQLCEDRCFEELRKALSEAPGLRLTAKKDEKEDYEPVKEQVAACRKRASALTAELKEAFFSAPFAEQAAEINQTAPKGQTLQKLLIEFDRLFRQAKDEKKVIDFSDIEHDCLEILRHEEPAEFYREKFQYIFIDEYQDTNILQEEIISRIKRSNNLFMVGDVKQSIYKFRLAEPEIFRARYAAYNGKDHNSVKIDLNRNFRSKPAILEEINRIFANLMEDYDEAAMLYPGLSYEGPLNYSPQMKLVDVSTVDETDEELAGLKNTELEALAVCRLIRENLGKEFYDYKAGAVRRLKPQDIVILMRGVRNYAGIFYQTLKKNGIESFVDESEGYFDTMEIEVFMNLLSVIDNKLQDIPLISVLHSEIFGFSAEALAAVRAPFREGSFAESLASYSDQGADPDLRMRCRQVLKQLKKWKSQSGSQPLGRFIWDLLLETGYYIKMGAMPGGRQRQANLRALVDKAENYSKDRQSSLYSFVRYIDAVKQKKVPMGQVKLVGENDELVRIMTIHKSKGLEFPMVIVSGMGRRLNYTKQGSGVALHKDIGVALTLVNYEEGWYRQTLLQTLLQKQMHREEVEEEIRILYVALTRAKDVLYLTGTVRDGKKYLEGRYAGLTGDSSYLDMLGELSSLELISAQSLITTENEGKTCFGNPACWDIYDGDPSEAVQREIFRRLNYVYPHRQARQMKSKYSVTEINRMETLDADAVQRYDAVLAVPKFRQKERPLTPAEKGTVYHGIMERIDLQRADLEGENYLTAAAKEWIEKEIFTKEEIAAVNLRRIEEFLEKPLGRRCVKAFREGKLRRERPFNLKMEIAEETVIVQGVIDCYFEEEDGLVLLDYKTSRIDGSKPFEEEAARLRTEYRRQVEIYCKALSEATGKQVKEAYLYLFEPGKSVAMQKR